MSARRDIDLTEFSTGEFAGSERKSDWSVARLVKGARRKIQKAFEKTAETRALVSVPKVQVFGFDIQ
ncbi:MAG: hypothetical protein M3525_15205 [Acidobacteriota bacterium]|nr:hypothetical protein [Acidobacteriota bacterium]